MAVATSFISTTNTLLHISTSLASLSSLYCTNKHNNVTDNLVVPMCKATSSLELTPRLSKRSFALSLSSAFLLSLAEKAIAAPLEAEDDLELLEKVKQDRKKRLERQRIINSSTKEKGYLQDVVYKLSVVGQAIENNDLSAASSVLGTNKDTDWIKKANLAFAKISSSDEEKAEVDTFNTSISTLISSVSEKDMELSKIAFVSSATAFEKWSVLTGLDGQLKGL